MFPCYYRIIILIGAYNIRSLIQHSKLILNTNSYDYTIHNGIECNPVYFTIPDLKAQYNLISFIRYWGICYISFNINII